MDHDQPADGEYQSLSPLAAVALVLGLASPVALADPLFLIVPAAAIGAAALALTKIRSSGGTLTGAPLARWGMALAIACTVASFVRGPVHATLVRRQTDAVAKAWLQHLADAHYDEALALIGGQGMQSLRPQSDGQSSDPPPLELVQVQVREKLRKDPLATWLAGLSEPLRVESLPGGDRPVFDGPRTTAFGTYRVGSGAKAPARQVQLRFSRTPQYETQGEPWRVEYWALRNDDAATPAAGSTSGS